MKQPNIFKRIYNKIIELANKITGNSKESRFIKDLKNKWETAYRNTTTEQAISNLNSETKYMIAGIKGTKNAIKNDSNNYFLKNNYDKAQKYAKDKIENNQIRKKTGWFQDSRGDWKFEISDEDAKIIKRLEENKVYKLGEILKHSDLYEMYPNLKNNKVKFTNFDIRVDENGKRYKTKGRFNNITNIIFLNNELISSGNDVVLDTFVHEIQHWVQKIEKFTQGTTSANGFENYLNNLGEKEARSTTERRKMNYETRLENPPASLLNEGKIDKQKNKWYSLNEVEENVEKNKEVFSQNLSEDIYNRRIFGRNNGEQELDNSSFSFANLPKIKKGHTRLYRGLNNEYNPNYDRSRLDSPNGYDTLTDNYELAKKIWIKTY